MSRSKSSRCPNGVKKTGPASYRKGYKSKLRACKKSRSNVRSSPRRSAPRRSAPRRSAPRRSSPTKKAKYTYPAPKGYYASDVGCDDNTNETDCGRIPNCKWQLNRCQARYGVRTGTVYKGPLGRPLIGGRSRKKSTKKSRSRKKSTKKSRSRKKSTKKSRSRKKSTKKSRSRKKSTKKSSLRKCKFGVKKSGKRRVKVGSKMKLRACLKSRRLK
jgi:hypothetical protein